MKKFLLGLGLGAALVYFLDTERGEARRIRAAELAKQYLNSDTVTQARQTATEQARNLGQQLSQQAGVVTDRVNQMRASRSEPTPASVMDQASHAANDAAASVQP